MMKKRAFIWGLVALVFLLLFPFSASASVVDYVDLSPEQTLALYGNTISGSYWNGSEYDSCTFTYCYTLQSTESNPILFSSRGFDDAEKTYMSERKYLVYKMDGSSLINDDIIVTDKTRITLQLRPSISISGITYFRQFIGFAFDQNQSMNNSPILEGSGNIAPYDYNYISSLCSYSPSPIVTHYKRHYYSNAWRLAYIRYDIGYDVLGQNPPDFEDPDLHPNCSVFDVYLQNLVDGQEQTFDFTGQELSFSGAKSVGFTSTVGNITSRDRDYLVYLSCPRLSDGYVLPDKPETTPNYSGQLDDINVSIGSTNTLLQQILAKLDAIYAKMNAQGISISGTVEIGGPSINNIGIAIGNSVGSAIQSLFVPSQSDLMNFRLSMQTMCDSSLAPFFDVEQLRDNAIDRIMQAPVVDYVDLPLVNLTDFGIPFSLDGSEFPGYEIVDNSVRVPLRLGSDWSFFYELVAWGFDVIATLAFVNMVITKLHALYTGEKVVEVDDN